MEVSSVVFEKGRYMKKLILIIFVLIFLTGCSPLITDTVPVVPETIIVTETVTVEDTAKINELQKQLTDSQTKTEQYQDLIANLNNLLKNVYYGYAENNNYKSDGFTAFSIKYNDKFYLITAGHCVHYNYGGIDTGAYTSFKFKANFSNKWIYPKLLTYENDFNGNRDYAIFYSDKIIAGFKTDKDNDIPEYILGNEYLDINTIKLTVSIGIEGESGSPVIDPDGEVVKIYTGNFVDIDLVIQAINNLK